MGTGLPVTIRTGLFAVVGAVSAGRRQDTNPVLSVPGAIRTRTGSALDAVPLPLGYEDRRASARIRTAGLPLTRRAL